MITIIILILSHNNILFEDLTHLKYLWISNENIMRYNDKNYNIKQYLIEYDENLIEEEYIIDENKKKILIKGNESLIPGCFYKTIKAINIVKDEFNPDYILRTNLSTTFNFKKIKNMIIKLENKSELINKTFLAGPIIKPDSIEDLKLLLFNLYENIDEKDKNKLNENSINFFKNEDKSNIIKKNKQKKSYVHGIFMLMNRQSYSFLINNYKEIITENYIRSYYDDIIISKIFSKKKHLLVNIQNKIKTNTNLMDIDNIDKKYVEDNIYFRCKIDNTYTSTKKYVKKVIDLLNN